MIYSKFGSKLTPISKSADANGRVVVQATAEGAPDARDYQISELKADEGSAEISELVATLPQKVVADIPSARKRIAELPKTDRQQHRSRRRG